MTKTYPKNTIRRIIKAHEPNHNLSKTADVLVLPPPQLVAHSEQVYLDYVLFMKELMKEADISARQVGDTKIRASHVQRNLGV
jgi:hypothetical protein